MNVVIIGGGIGGLTLALMLARHGIAARVFEAAPRLKPAGVGINLLPHATRALAELGLEPALAKVGITTRESVFFNRFGQLIYREPAGRFAGYDWPQFSLHRGDLQQVLLDAFAARIGPPGLFAGWRCIGLVEDPSGAVVHFRNAVTGAPLPAQHADVLIGCDGLHSMIRRALHPEEGEAIYSGVNMWRGVASWQPFLTGASMVRAGWLKCGKMVIYPIRDRIDGQGRQLINWVAEIETPQHQARDWNRRGRSEDFIAAYENWHFDWLDVPALIRASDTILEFPMVDQEPLPWWSRGRVTLLGDAAHPMYPRGSNGAGQAILDAQALAECLPACPDPAVALKTYEAKRLAATASVVRMNRVNPPDAILREVYERSGDRPFERIEELISSEEMKAISEGYKRVAGYDRDTLAGPLGGPS